MRLIATLSINELKQMQQFSAYASSLKIQMHLEIHEKEVELWALDEDSLDKCQEIYKEFIQNPKDPKYKIKKIRDAHEAVIEQKESLSVDEDMTSSPRASVRRFNNKVTKIFVALCIFFYLIGLFENFGARSSGNKLRGMILTRSKQALLFDYPVTLSLINEFAIKFGHEVKNKPEDLTPEAKALLQKIDKEPYFQGLYKAIVNYKNFHSYWDGPKFGSIKRAELWRLITPTFLHASFLHILFNMLWLFLLGKLVETNLGSLGYFFLTLFLSVSTNVLQYLMTGPLFMGYSGVVAGLAGYIWVRQKKAAYEFYPIERKVLRFLGIFVFGLLALQLIAFVLQLLHVLEFNIQIANTAHVSGVALGYIVGKLQPGGHKRT